MARNAETIRKEIKAIAAAQEKLSVRTARCAGWCLEHYIKHGDTSLCSMMTTELKGKGSHRRGLIQWFEKWGRMKLQADGATFKMKDGAKRETIDLDKALSSPYYADEDAMGQTGQDAKTFNEYGRLKSLLSKSDKIAAEYSEYPENFKERPIMMDAKDKALIKGILDKWEISKDLDKPQPKADKPLFQGAHKVHLPVGSVTNTTSKVA